MATALDTVSNFALFYENPFNLGTTTSDAGTNCTVDSSHPVSDSNDGLLSTYHQIDIDAAGTPGIDFSFTLDLGSGVAGNYSGIIIANHNLNSQTYTGTNTVKLQYSSDNFAADTNTVYTANLGTAAEWTNSSTPASNTTSYFFTDGGDDARYWRIRFDLNRSGNWAPTYINIGEIWLVGWYTAGYTAQKAIEFPWNGDSIVRSPKENIYDNRNENGAGFLHKVSKLKNYEIGLSVVDSTSTFYTAIEDAYNNYRTNQMFLYDPMETELIWGNLTNSLVYEAIGYHLTTFKMNFMENTI